MSTTKTLYARDEALWREAQELARAQGKSLSETVELLLMRWTAAERLRPVAMVRPCPDVQRPGSERE
jgi:hypothetical protein